MANSKNVEDVARPGEQNQWILDGIAREREQLTKALESIPKRLAYLQKQETELRGRAMTGTAAPSAKTAGTVNGKTGGQRRRKRVISEETRQKMRAAQQRRHAKNRKVETTAVPPTGSVPVEIPATVAEAATV